MNTPWCSPVASSQIERPACSTGPNGAFVATTLIEKTLRWGDGS
jgi:hypothetical protein